jgi:hypothetical protein
VTVGYEGGAAAVISGCRLALRTALGLIVLATIGCATTAPTPRTITDINQLAGSWHGWIGCYGCPERFRASLEVRPGGYWQMTTRSNPARYGKFGIVNGVLMHGNDGWWSGPVTVVEERGREYMTLRRQNEVWTEFDRAKPK